LIDIYIVLLVLSSGGWRKRVDVYLSASKLCRLQRYNRGDRVWLL